MNHATAAPQLGHRIAELGRASRRAATARREVFPFLAGTLIALGVILRIHEFMSFRSLWLDEALLSLNVVELSLFDLMRGLQYEQAAPLGYVFVQKLFVMLLGEGEGALRLFSLLCGCASLWFFYRLCKLALPKEAQLLALALFATSEPLIRYASEAKPYQCDVLFGLLVSLEALAAARSPTSRSFGRLAMVGVISIWFSFPSIFFLGGAGAMLLFSRQVRYRRYEAILMGCAWGISFALNYFTVIKSASGKHFLQVFWRMWFLPHVLDFGWMQENLMPSFFAFLRLPWLAAAQYLALLGLVYLALRSREAFLLFGAALVLMAIASTENLYPLFERLLLFVVPSIKVGSPGACIKRSPPRLERSLEKNL